MRYASGVSAVMAFLVASHQAPLFAQIARRELHVVGRVRDELGRALMGVEVIMNGGEWRAATGSGGLFSVRITPTDSIIGFRRIGYRPVTLELRPLPSPNDTIVVELRASPVQLPELTVTVAPTKPLRYAYTTRFDDVFRRKRVGLGTLLDRHVIERKFGESTAELLQGIAGVRYWVGPPKNIRFARCVEPGGVSVFIDGFRQTVGSDSVTQSETPVVQMLSRVDPTDIEMIEVFRGAAQIPAEFHWNGCAVVAIWTRWNR